MFSSSSYPGRVVAGRFQVERSIGEGASGTVWGARDLTLGIRIALKMMRSSLRAHPARRLAFEREARLCERMLSPNVVRMLAFGVDANDVPYIAYELLEGASLQERLAEKGALDLDALEATVVQVARGLARAHALGVCHRDIKPSNVFLTVDDRDKSLVKILDFGVACLAAGTPSQPEGVFGTVEYLAPEVVLQKADADPRSDLYSLAVLAYECLTGAPPFRVGSLHDAVVRIAVGPSAPPSVEPVVGALAARPLDGWFAKGLAREPGGRFQSARELAEELHRAVKEAKTTSLSRLRASTEAPPPPPSSARLEGPRRSTVSLPAVRPRLPSFVFEAACVAEEVPTSSVRRTDPRQE